MHKYLPLTIHFISSLATYILLSLQRYTINYLMTALILSLLILSLYSSLKYLFSHQETMLKLISIFIIFIYVSAAERAFILITTLSNFDVYIGLMIIALITLEIVILFYYVLKGPSGERIVKMEYRGYA